MIEVIDKLSKKEKQLLLLAFGSIDKEVFKRSIEFHEEVYGIEFEGDFLEASFLGYDFYREILEDLKGEI